MKTSNCLILKQMDFKEKDKLITFLDCESGKKSGLIFGAKSLKSRHLSSSEPFIHVRLVYQEHPARELVQIKNCDLLESYPGLRQNYNKFLYACYVSELVLACKFPESEARIYYDLLRQSYSDLQSEGHESLIKLLFEIRLLELLGISPNLSQCIKCDKQLWKQSTIFPAVFFHDKHQLDASEGGVRCPSCITGNDQAIWISAGTLSYLKHITSLVKPMESTVKATAQNLSELNLALSVYLNHHLETQLQSHKLLKIQT
ncbi:MAG: DNA repair protein RecO [SAR324 cluster bacterium]|nr:DNA repair protein RecO [SAR324 cluster bacterium]